MPQSPLQQWIAEHFEKTQVIFILVVLIAAWLSFRSKKTESRFRTREADRPDLDQLLSRRSVDQKKNQPLPPKLALPGIRLHGAPHEVLGVAESATEADILKAYKDGMKRYHPDLISGQAKEQMQFYQDAATQLNKAKEEMLKLRKSGR